MEIFSNNKHPSLFCLRVNYIKKCYKASNSTFTGFHFLLLVKWLVLVTVWCKYHDFSGSIIKKFLKTFSPLSFTLNFAQKEFFLKWFHHAWQFVEIMKKKKKKFDVQINLSRWWCTSWPPVHQNNWTKSRSHKTFWPIFFLTFVFVS